MTLSVSPNGGAGWMTRLHISLWAASSPRMDVFAEDEKAHGACGRGDRLLEPEAVRQLGDCFGRQISAIRPENPPNGQEGRARSKHPNRPQASHVRAPCAVGRVELRRIPDPAGGDSGADFDRSVGMLAELAEFPNMREWRAPYAKGHPAPHQSCAKFPRGEEGADSEITYCGKMSPGDPVRSGREFRREGPTRPDLFRILFRRNCAYGGNFNPVIIIIISLLANMEIHGCDSKYGVTSCVTTYVDHHGAKSGPPSNLQRIGGAISGSPDPLRTVWGRCMG